MDCIMKNELISVIMSVYNETIDELKRSIESILKQSYSNIEFIIINDDPDNRTIKKYLIDLKDERLRIYNNESNMGLVKSLNKALKLCNGKYIARMDADDYSYVDRLSKELKFLKENNYDLVGCFDCEVRTDKKSYFKKPIYFKEVNKILKKRNCMSHPTWLVKKDIYDVLNGYRDVLGCEDYDFLLRALSKGYKIGNCPEYLLDHYVRDISVSRSNKALQLLISDYLSKNINNLDNINIEDFINSKKTKKDIDSYNKCSQFLKDKKIIILLFNKWFYKRIKIKIDYVLNI